MKIFLLQKIKSTISALLVVVITMMKTIRFGKRGTTQNKRHPIDLLNEIIDSKPETIRRWTL